MTKHRLSTACRAVGTARGVTGCAGLSHCCWMCIARFIAFPTAESSEHARFLLRLSCGIASGRSGPKL